MDRILCEGINAHSLIVLNPLSFPTCVSHPFRNPSTIDLAIASCGIASKCDVRVPSDLFGSDHHPVEVRINCLVRTVSIFSYKINFTPSQWAEIKQYLCDNGNSISQSIASINPDDLLIQYNTFLELISQSFKTFLPSNPCRNRPRMFDVARTNKGPPPALWWTPECTKAVKTLFYRSILS